MSRLSEILNVEEGQEFQYENDKFKVIKNIIFILDIDGLWQHFASLASAHYLMQIIASPEKIKIIPTKPKLTEKQIIAIKGRIAEGWNWAVTDSGNVRVVCFTEKPIKDDYTCYSSNGEADSLANKDIFDFVTYENSPVYLPELINKND